jgi:hypothetical protein
MNNILTAIINISKSTKMTLRHKSTGNNRVQNMGEALEKYIQDVFSNTMEVSDQITRTALLSNTFSYLGNANNPPDMMLLGGDAIEVKKIQSPKSAIALNSSYPKAKLFASSHMISKACRESEVWEKKDMIYAIGVVHEHAISSLAFVYGEDYCAENATYEKIKKTIKDGVESIPNVAFSESKELGHVNRVDPLGITYLRIRGMWGIENPFSVFDYVYQRNMDHAFNFMCIINDEKFNSFENTIDLYEECKKNKRLHISDIRIKDANNPARLKSAKLITYYIPEQEAT